MWQRLVIGIALMLSVTSSLCAANEYHVDTSHEVAHELLSGDDFRRYVTQHIDEQNTWSQAMRTFGSLDNFMHELMTAMARHGALERGDTVPEFEHRISAQKWRAYRETLSKNIEVSVWSTLVQVTEAAHEEAHRTMVRALLYDVEAFHREADLTAYLKTETLPDLPAAVASVHALPHSTLDDFRNVVWTYRAERRHWHSAMQQALVFGHMLDDLLTQWLVYGAEHKDRACQPDEGALYQRGHAWAEYVDTVAACTDTHWRDLVQQAGEMRERIHQMLHLMTNYRDWSVPTSLSLPALPSVSQEYGPVSRFPR